MSAIAIVGMGCRFAGAPDLHAYWEQMLSGQHGFGPVPPDRWPQKAFYDPSRRATDKTYAPAGGFIQDIRSFPALFLGIPPRRVEVMDPQQRMSIEVGLQAIHDAGYRPSEMPHRTGVFMGVTASEFRVLLSSRVIATMMATGQLGEAGEEDAEVLARAVEHVVPSRPFTAPGALANMIAAAVAQELDLHGPAYTVDAACASAIVAVGDAVAQLRTNAIDAALVGGVYLQITPEHYIAFSRIGAMSAQGLCLPFDARADGFVQGDGAGVVVLKRLEDAREAGDRIYAVIEGIALNNDGRGDGPMAPVRGGQQEVIHHAWQDAGIDPDPLGYMETHGTGTDVGDVAELEALLEAFGDRVSGVQLGSSKANVGHTMSAAGVAGLIRAALAIRHGTIPPMAGFEQPKEELQLHTTPFEVPTAPVPWEATERVAAVSSFGFGGTNGHVVLRSPPATQRATEASQLEVVRISAGTAEGLARTAERLAATLRRDPALSVASVARTWGARPSLAHRAALVAATPSELLEALDAVAEGSFPRSGAVGEADGPAPKVALLFPGQGAQRLGMLSDVGDRFDVVAEALADADSAVSDLMDLPVSHLLYPQRRDQAVSEADAKVQLTATEHCQPVLVATGLALFALLQKVQVKPQVACGHSLGEFAAAAVGGVITTRDAVRFAALRGRAMSQVSGDPGTMAALMCDADTAEQLLVEGAVLANDNHPRQVVVSGRAEAVSTVVTKAAGAGIEAKALDVSHAFHSPVFDDVDSDALVRQITFDEPNGVVVASGIAEQPYGSRDDAVGVFRRHITSPVRFQGALQQCVEAGADLFLQVGAGGPLASFARKVVGADARAVLSLAGLDDADGGRTVLETLGWLWVHGVDLDTRSITADAAVVSLPPQELPREYYWPVKDAAQKRLQLSGLANTAQSVAQGAQVQQDAPSEAASSGDDVYDKVADVVARVSSYPRKAVRPELSLVDDLGFDSLMVTDLATGLADAFPGLGGLPQELMLNRPTVQAIVDHVRSGPDAAMGADRDDEPLSAHAPVWRAAPLPEGAPGDEALAGWTILLTGQRDEDVTAALKSAGATVTRRAQPGVDAVVHHASFDDPVPVTAVLAGEQPLPDPAAELLGVLDDQAEHGNQPSVVVIRRDDDPWTEALAGVVRSASREWSGAVYKTVAFHDIDASFRAARLVQELVSSDTSLDVRWNGDGRSIAGLQPLQSTPPLFEPGPDHRVLITGGTRGIGLALAKRLRATGAEVVVVGRSAPDALPDGIVAVAADVTDGEGLTSALAEHRPFTAVVHAAGVLADGAIGSVEPQAGALSRAIKVGGFVNAVLAAGPEVVVAMGIGSWAGRFGNRHQAHYAAGNAALAGLAHASSEGPRLVVGEFGPWTSSDMAATIPEVVRAAMRAEGVDFVGDEPGLDALLADLTVGSGARVYGRDLPFWSRRRAVVTELSTESHPYLLDHAIEGVPVLPLAGAADLIASAASVPHPFEVADLKLFTGVTASEPVTLRAVVDGERVQLRMGERDTLAYQARVRPATMPEDPDRLQGGEPPAVELDAFYRDLTFHGPLLQGLVRVDGIGDDFARGAVRSAAPSEWIPQTSRTAWATDPLALDAAFQLGALVVWQRYERAGTPVAIRRLVQVKPASPGILTVEARYDQAEGDRFEASFWLRDPEGQLVAVAEGTVAEMRSTDDPAGDFEVKPEWVDPSHWQELRDLDQRLEMAKAIGLDNPYFHVHQGTARDTTMVDGHELVNFSSYNYIGLSGDPRVVEAVQEAVARYGTSVSASRVASGERPFHRELEAELAAAQGQDDALVFTAGHMTNVNVVGHLMQPADLVLHDELIHDSLLQGIKLSGAGRRAFRHEDPEHLEQLLKELRHHNEKCLIVVEGVYSMDGDLSVLPAFVALKERYGCLLMVDEAHSFGVVGETGCGIGEHHRGNIDPRQADLWMGTLSKSLASCGGWIAGSADMIRYLRYTAPGFVYSAGITAANGVAALMSLRLMLEEPWRVHKLQTNAATFHAALTERGVDTGPALGGSGVIPAVTGNSMHALVLSQRLREQGVNVQPIVYPAVADDAARLRFFLSSTHSTEQLVHTAELVATNLETIRSEYPT
ncbi:MAG: aminotransferase class I/II-fold pyridoxal phosphate-dependent enzyme [Myxococcales bacterium]|nr:aminotransferase class I/II-fold pyridoxal phosphate-dependent enzyme [Myxococcales bacterium]